MKNKINFDLSDQDLKLLPYSDELERQVLSAILNKPEIYPECYRYLNAKGIFYGAENAELWEIIRFAANDTDGISTSKIRGIYEAKRDNEKSMWLLTLMSTYFKHSQIQNYCLKLNEYWIARTNHRMGHYINQNALKEGIDQLELLGIASESIDKIYRHIAQMNEKTVKDGIRELAQELHDISIAPGGMLGLRGSLPEMNDVLKGYRKGGLIIVAASTGEGKTTFEMQEIRHLLEQGVSVGCFSLEMKTSELLLMMSCNATDIPTEIILEGRGTAEQMREFSTYLERVKKMPLHINDKPAIKIGELKAISRMWVKNSGIKMLFIDHIHLMEGDVQYTNPEQKYTDIANQIKALAKELDIPIIALAQLTRKEKGVNRVHHISDIKYAGGIEQAADVVILIYRPMLHGIETDANGASTEGFSRFIIGKLRLLPKRDVKCYFNGMRFTDWNEHQFKQLPRPEAKPNAGFQNIRQPYKDSNDPYELNNFFNS